MAYTPVPSQSVGDEVTAAEFNAWIRDNFAAGVPDIFTTKGDLPVASGADAAGRLPVGANGTVLTADSAEALGMKWSTLANVTAARYKRTTTQSIASGSAVILDYATQDYDPGSAVTTGAAWHYTAPSTGYYVVVATALLAAAAWDANEYLLAGVYKGGVLQANLGIRVAHTAAVSYQMFVNGMTILSLAASDQINVRVTQNSGSAINVVADGNYSHISIARLF